MIETFYGTLTFALFLSSLAVLIGLLLFNFILMPVIKVFLTPVLNIGYSFYELINKIFPKKEKEEKSEEYKENIILIKLKRNYLKIIAIVVFIPFMFFLVHTNSMLLHSKIFVLNGYILLDVFFSVIGLLIYGVVITLLLKSFTNDDYKLYSPIAFIVMSIIIINDKFF